MQKRKIVEIATGGISSVMLDSEGVCYLWSNASRVAPVAMSVWAEAPSHRTNDRKSRQAGLSEEAAYRETGRVEKKRVLFSQIACGEAHAVALGR